MAGRNYNRPPAEVPEPPQMVELMNEALTAPGRILEADRKNLDKIFSTDITSSRLTYVGPADGKDKVGRRLSRYRCLCGNEILRARSVVEGKNTMKSCGCLKLDRAMLLAIAQRDKQHAAGRIKNRTHGESKTLLYGVWNSMIQRCTNPNTRSYAIYGGRGIAVCERWRKFENFYADMALSYQLHRQQNTTTTIERRDPDGDYTPENCTWTTRKVQSRNKRISHRLTYMGRTLSVYDWSDELGIKASTIEARLKRGWSVEDSLGKAVG